MLSSVPVAFAPIVRSSDVAVLISVKPRAFMHSAVEGGEPLLQPCEQGLCLCLAHPVEQGAEQDVPFLRLTHRRSAVRATSCLPRSSRCRCRCALVRSLRFQGECRGRAATATCRGAPATPAPACRSCGGIPAALRRGRCRTSLFFG